MTVDENPPGSNPPVPHALRSVCAAAARGTCGYCWAVAGEPCVSTTAPVSVPVVPGTDVYRVRGYHAARFTRAARHGLLADDRARAVTAGLLPGAVVWDNGDTPRQPDGQPEYGPFDTERQARETLAVRGVFAAVEADSRRGVLAEANHRMLDEACTAAGAEPGAYDHRILLWLAGFEPQACAVIAGLITRARIAGEAAGR